MSTKWFKMDRVKAHGMGCLRNGNFVVLKKVGAKAPPCRQARIAASQVPGVKAGEATRRV
jgi:hypothetical protein